MSGARRCTDAANEEGPHHPHGDGEPIRREEGRGRLLRLDQQGHGEGRGEAPAGQEEQVMRIGRTGHAVYFAPDVGGTPGGTPSGGAPPAFAASLPEAIRGEAAFKDVKDVGDLAARYLTASKPKVFAEMLPEKIRGEAAFKDLKSVEDLAHSYLGQGKLLGVPKDRLLTLPATPEDAEGWKAVHLKLGMPEKPDGYKLTAPNLPEGMKVDEKLQGSFLKKVHSLGGSNAVADGLFQW